MYEMERFNWQKLLINNVPHKGGARYAAVPPPPDYSPQWNAAQSLIQSSEQTMQSISDKVRQIPSLPDPQSQLIIAEQVNIQIDAKVRETDDVVAKVSSIPDSAFNTESLNTLGLNKAGALGLINNVRSGLLNSKVTINIPVTPPPPPPPPPPQVIITPPIVITPGTPSWAGVGQGERLVPFVVSPAYAANGIIYPSDYDVPAGLPYYTKEQAGVSYRTYSPPPPPYIPPPYVPTYYELLASEVDKQTRQLQQLNRVWGKPIEPAQPTHIWPTTSWQYEMWNRGYSVKEISFAEGKAAQQNLLTKTNGDFALFKKEVENIIQDAIISKEIPAAITDEIITQPGIVDPVNLTLIEPEIRCSIPPTPSLPMPVLPKPSCDLPIPLPKDSDPRRMPRRRGFIPTLPKPAPELNPVNGGQGCITGIIGLKGDWESILMGQGATVDELDTVRRMMTTAKFSGAGEQYSAARAMLDRLRQQNGTNTVVVPPPAEIPLSNIITPAVVTTKAAEAEIRRQIARQRALNKTTTEATKMSAPIAVKANAIARRQTSLVRRGALNGQNLRKI